MVESIQGSERRVVIRRVLAWSISPVVAIAAFCAGVAGCGGSSVRNNEEGGGSGETSVGGTGVGGTSVGGAGAGGASQSCARTLPDTETVGCDWRAALGGPGQSPAGYCHKAGCHNGSIAAGGLDLTPDDFLAARLLNVPAKHDILCVAEAAACDVAAPMCDACSECVLGDVLVSTVEPGAGVMFDRMAPFIPGTTTTTLQLGCGKAMPTFDTTGTGSYTQTHKECLVRFFSLLARTPGSWPCGAQ